MLLSTRNTHAQCTAAAWQLVSQVTRQEVSEITYYSQYSHFTHLYRTLGTRRKSRSSRQKRRKWEYCGTGNKKQVRGLHSSQKVCGWVEEKICLGSFTSSWSRWVPTMSPSLFGSPYHHPTNRMQVVWDGGHQYEYKIKHTREKQRLHIKVHVGVVNWKSTCIKKNMRT